MPKDPDDFKERLAQALQELGPITPWWSEEDEMYVFEHPLYPRVLHSDPDQQEVVNGYKRALEAFIAARLVGALSTEADRLTSGRGGIRPGAGRPRGQVKEPTRMIRLPATFVEWLKKDPKNLEKALKLAKEA